MESGNGEYEIVVQYTKKKTVEGLKHSITFPQNIYDSILTFTIILIGKKYHDDFHFSTIWVCTYAQNIGIF